ncbi:AtpZ/AtpI family protein [Haliscomenobacter sp.]|uniref:AtpZ/AtpI family protein n=1 Tax=Haliscomenobacter sp. TaxID=2717303 RepID=UPI003BA86C89
MKKESKHPITDPEDPSDFSKGKATSNVYLKYSGMAFQMGIIILIGALLGRKLDAYFHSPKPWFTVALSLLAIFAALYSTLKDLLAPNKKNQPPR